MRSSRRRDLNRQAQRFARDTADEVRNRSEAALKDARKRSEKTLRLVRDNFETAQKRLEKQTDRLGLGKLPELTKLPELAKKQLSEIEEQLRQGVEWAAKALQIATEHDLDALRRKVAALEKRVSELTRESAAA
ncbi:MAG: hypothetical protein FJ144_22015 [Deltaproteobacteria bacterium]|nr:hypothetical protein [Deltaproteobacteria bacterium]